MTDQTPPNEVGLIELSFVIQSDEDVSELRERLLTQGGAEEVRLEDVGSDEILPVIATAYIVLGIIGLGVVTRIADWLRDRNDCLLVIDARGDNLKIEERCDIEGRRGQVVVVTGSNEQVVIHKNEAVLDLQRLVECAFGRSTADLIDFAKSQGGDANFESPRSPL